MKEAYSEKYKVHDVYSFCFFFMANLAEHLIYSEFMGWSDKEKKYYELCYSILKEDKFCD